MPDVMNLLGKKAIIIGGSDDIWLWIAQSLAAGGADVSIAGAKLGQLMVAKKKIETVANAQISVYTVDSSDEESIRTLVDTVKRDKGTVDFLINIPSQEQSPSKHDLPLTVMKDSFRMNVFGIAMRSSN